MSTQQPPEYSLTSHEMVRFDWLLKVAQGVEDAEDMFDKLEYELRSRDGTKSERVVDWNQINRYLFPMFVVVMLRNPWKEEHTFYEHPRYVVVTRTGATIDLLADRILTLETGDPGAQDEATSSLNQLSTQISKLEGDRKSVV